MSRGRPSPPAKACAHTIRLRLLLVACVPVIFALQACSSRTGSAPEGDGRFWETLRVEGDEVEYFPSLADMVKSADAVVVGTFEGFSASRTIVGDAPEDSVLYGKATLLVSEVLTGPTLGDTVPVEFLLPIMPGEGDAIVQEMAASLPKSEMVLFLRAKLGTNEGGLFRLVNSYGLWAQTERSALDTPLSELTPMATGVYAEELMGIATLEEFVEYIKGLTTTAAG